MLEGECCELSTRLRLVLWGRCMYVLSLSSERKYNGLGEGGLFLMGNTVAFVWMFLLVYY